jgi:hypothetical protein
MLRDSSDLHHGRWRAVAHAILAGLAHEQSLAPPPAQNTDLGNIHGLLRLACNVEVTRICGWCPPLSAKAEVIGLHAAAEHDQHKSIMALVPQCPCGVFMTLEDSRPTGGRSKEYFLCTRCGNKGHIYRKEAAG